MSIESNPGYKAVVNNQTIPHGQTWAERQAIGQGVAAAKTQQGK